MWILHSGSKEDPKLVQIPKVWPAACPAVRALSAACRPSQGRLTPSAGVARGCQGATVDFGQLTAVGLGDYPSVGGSASKAPVRRPGFCRSEVYVGLSRMMNAEKASLCELSTPGQGEAGHLYLSARVYTCVFVCTFHTYLHRFKRFHLYTCRRKYEYLLSCIVIIGHSHG